MLYPPKLYSPPMLVTDAARLIRRAARIFRTQADLFEREVERLNRQKTVTRAEAKRLGFEDMGIPHLITPANAKPRGRGPAPGKRRKISRESVEA
jgi:hypothetical protein